MGRICAVTGASGYVGSCVVSRLTDAGWEVRALGRSRPNEKQQSVTNAHFELGQPPAPEALADADALLHLAYDFTPQGWAEIERVNVTGSRLLLEAAREAGIDRIVYMSSVAAHPGARAMYGRAKLACERDALAAGAAILRPGSVWGPRGAATPSALERAVESLPVVPLPVPGDIRLFLTHEDDLSSLVQGVLEQWPAGSGKLYVATSARWLEFAQYLRLLAQNAGASPRFVELPWRFVRLGLKALEGIGLDPPFRSDGILSLVSGDEQPLSRATDDVDRYGVSFRPFAPA
ncbi:MAG TPA: NAD-dependent epimerase/dehydratase family protein [Solirubrobacteraceae bacterium]|jgi:nucleoside-diphosphate-sugar epimerase